MPLRFLLVTLFTFLPCLAIASPPKFSILFTDGFKGRLQTNASGIGLSALAKNVREQRAALGEDNVVTLDLGNSIAPYYLSRMDEGDGMLAAMAELGYDAMVPGNDEFEYGKDRLRQTAVPMVCANLVSDSDGIPPYRIVARGEAKIAIIGVMDTSMRRLILDENFNGLRLVEPLNALKTAAAEARREADFLVVISNLPYEKNLELAHQLPEVDVFIGRRGVRFGEQYALVKRPNGATAAESDTVVVTAGAYLGQIDIQGDTVVAFKRIAPAEVRPPDPETRDPDPGLVEHVERQEALFRRYTESHYQSDPDATLCELPSDISPTGFSQYALYVMLQQTHSELALIHHGHFDFSDWERIVADGRLTLRECYVLMPENHGLLTTRLTGKALNQLESQSKAEASAGRDYLHFLSVNPVLDENAPWLVHRLPIRDSELYAACAINVLLNGATAFQEITKGTHVKTKFKRTSYLRFFPDGETKVIREIVIEHLRSQSPNRLLETGDRLAHLPYLQRPLWKLEIEDTGLSLNLSRDRKTDTYPDVTIPELQQADITSLRLQGHARVARETASMLWENALQTELGQIKVGDEPFEEDKDDFSLATRLILKSLGIKGVEPFAGMRFDTAFTKNDPEARQLDLIIEGGLALPARWHFSGTRLAYSRIFDLNTGETARKGLNAVGFETRLNVPLGTFEWRNTIHSAYFLPDSTVNSERRQLLITINSALNVPVVQNISLAPTFEALFFKGADSGTFAQKYLFSVRLSYFKGWKWQYMRYFLREGKE